MNRERAAQLADKHGVTFFGKATAHGQIEYVAEKVIDLVLAACAEERRAALTEAADHLGNEGMFEAEIVVRAFRNRDREPR